MTPKSPEEFEKMRAESRSNILNSALKLFAQHGYDATSVSDIAEEAGISKGLIYNYFDSKKQLLQDVINEGLRLMPEIFEQSEREVDTDTLESLLNRLRKSLKRDRLFWKFYAELLLQVLRQEQLAEQFEPTYEKFIGFFIQIMRQQGVDHPKLEGRKLAAILDGVALHSMFEEDYPIDDMFNYLIQSYSTSSNHD